MKNKNEIHYGPLSKEEKLEACKFMSDFILGSGKFSYKSRSVYDRFKKQFGKYSPICMAISDMPYTSTFNSYDEIRIFFSSFGLKHLPDLNNKVPLGDIDSIMPKDKGILIFIDKALSKDDADYIRGIDLNKPHNEKTSALVDRIREVAKEEYEEREVMIPFKNTLDDAGIEFPEGYFDTVKDAIKTNDGEGIVNKNTNISDKESDYDNSHNDIEHDGHGNLIDDFNSPNKKNTDNNEKFQNQSPRRGGALGSPNYHPDIRRGLNGMIAETIAEGAYLMTSAGLNKISSALGNFAEKADSSSTKALGFGEDIATDLKNQRVNLSHKINSISEGRHINGQIANSSEIKTLNNELIDEINAYSNSITSAGNMLDKGDFSKKDKDSIFSELRKGAKVASNWDSVKDSQQFKEAAKKIQEVVDNLVNALKSLFGAGRGKNISQGPSN